MLMLNINFSGNVLMLDKILILSDLIDKLSAWCLEDFILCDSFVLLKFNFAVTLNLQCFCILYKISKIT